MRKRIIVCLMTSVLIAALFPIVVKASEEITFYQDLPVIHINNRLFSAFPSELINHEVLAIIKESVVDGLSMYLTSFSVKQIFSSEFNPDTGFTDIIVNAGDERIVIDGRPLMYFSGVREFEPLGFALVTQNHQSAQLQFIVYFAHYDITSGIIFHGIDSLMTNGVNFPMNSDFAVIEVIDSTIEDENGSWGFPGFADILDFIIHIFIPREDFWEYQFDRLDGRLREKLPFQTYIDTIGRLREVSDRLDGAYSVFDITYEINDREFQLDIGRHIAPFLVNIRTLVTGLYVILLAYYNYRQVMFLIRGQNYQSGRSTQ